jgi:hypothetical protein
MRDEYLSGIEPAIPARSDSILQEREAAGCKIRAENQSANVNQGPSSSCVHVDGGGPTIRQRDYYDSYRLLSGYLALLDEKLPTDEMPPEKATSK